MSADLACAAASVAQRLDSLAGSVASGAVQHQAVQCSVEQTECSAVHHVHCHSAEQLHVQLAACAVQAAVYPAAQLHIMVQGVSQTADSAQGQCDISL